MLGLAIGAQVRERRQAMQISIRQAADRAGFSHSAWSKIERGESEPYTGTLEMIAGVLGCTAQDLTAYAPRQPVGFSLGVFLGQVDAIFADEPEGTGLKAAQNMALAAEVDDRRRQMLLFLLQMWGDDARTYLRERKRANFSSNSDEKIDKKE